MRYETLTFPETRNDLLIGLFLSGGGLTGGGWLGDHARKPTPTKPLDVCARCLPKNTSLIRTSPKAWSSKREQMSLNAYLHSSGEKTRNRPGSYNCFNVMELNIVVRNSHFKGRGTYSTSRVVAPFNHRSTFPEGRGGTWGWGRGKRIWTPLSLTLSLKKKKPG